MSKKPLISVENLTFTYADEPKPSLENINLKINEGEYVLILGPSGSGKSTLLLCLTGVIPQMIGGRMRGKVNVGGFDTTRTPLSQLSTILGFVQQDPEAQIISLNVEDELAFGLENLKVEEEEILRRIKEVLEITGLESFRESYCTALSGGQKQKLALAAYLAMRPKILALDTPASNLDPKMTSDLFGVIKGLNTDLGLTILIVEHKVDELINDIDRVILMDKGRILADGPPAQLFMENADHITELGVWVPQLMEVSIKAKGVGKTLEPAFTIEEELSILKKQEFVKQIEAFEETRANMDPSNMISVKDLDFTYPTGVQALKGVSLDVRKGDIVGILGENGAGKTTLAKHFIGLLRPPEGRVFVDGLDISKMSQYDITNTVGYVFQYPDRQFVADTVYDEVAYSLRVRQVDEDTIKGRVANILDIFQLTGLADKGPHTLSMGQKRRLSVATMLVLDQKVLILDEPTMGQSQGEIMALFKLIKEVNRSRGVTALVITHDMRTAAQWLNTTIVMSRGRVLYGGPVRDLFQKEEVLREASLYAPPVVRLAQELNKRYPQIPSDVLTADEFIKLLR